MLVRPKNPQKLITDLKKKPLVLYGFGGAGTDIGDWCSKNGLAYVFADQDAERKRHSTNKIVVLPEVLSKEYSDANIVISSIVYYDEIEKNLLASGIKKENILSYQLFLPEQITWRDLEHTTAWGTHMGRVEFIAQWIPDGVNSVADYGAGKLSLSKFLDPTVLYYPIDYIKRSEETVVCDFDYDDFPEIQTDVSVCTAVLVFTTRAKELLEHLCTHTAQTIILSYVLLETFSNIGGRRASGYVNDLTQRDIQSMLMKYGFFQKEIRPDPANKIDTMYLFCKK